MATFPNYELINKGGISLGTNFELLAEKPLDSRLVVPSLEALEHYINNSAAYEGMIVYVSSEKKHYEVKIIDGVLSHRQFGLTAEELDSAIAAATTAAMEFKGATAVLPENPSKGDMWKVTATFKVGEVDVKVGDAIVYNGEEWFVIPSGDDIEDTWRPVTDVNNDATLTFAAGGKLDVAVASNGTITYSHDTINAPELLAANEQTRTYITAVETDGYGHITGYKTATENVEDTDTTYTFEGQAEISEVFFKVQPKEGDEETVYLDSYSKNESDSRFKKVQDAYSAEGSTVKTITKVEQDANGKINVTYEDIALPAEDDFGVLGVTGDKGIEVDNTDAQNPVIKIADKAISAEQTKAYAGAEKTETEEVWIFYCGTSDFLV